MPSPHLQFVWACFAALFLALPSATAAAAAAPAAPSPASVTLSSTLVWPPPRSLSVSGPVLSLSAQFAFHLSSSSHSSPRMSAALARYTAHVARALAQPPPAWTRTRTEVSGADVLSHLQITVENGDETLGLSTQYSYELEIQPATTTANATATVTARSVYGAMYALESFTQLVEAGGVVPHSSVRLEDKPQNAWRGLMIDAGRRFFPVAVVKNMMETMAANKLNVLHLHASDFCRWGVESKLFPNLTASLTGIHGGFYTQADIADLVAFAKDRGIRVVPEFDIPGHSRGLVPLIPDGMQFCTDDATKSQLYGDPGNHTFDILVPLMKEMASLFPDEVFHIGADETASKGLCSTESTFDLERRILNTVLNEFGKRPSCWEEGFFNAGAATNDTIVNTWTRHHPPDVTSTGRSVVESANSHFYFTAPVPGGPKGWSKCWYDISTGVPAAERSLLLGGEMSMWSDSYCYIHQCGASAGAVPVGSTLFDPAHDAEFGLSIGGMIWPRGFVAAAAFWNYNATTAPDDPDFVAAVYKLNDDLQARGMYTCPTNCSCDQLSACGEPYIAPNPPQAARAAGAGAAAAAASSPPEPPLPGLATGPRPFPL